MIETIRTYTTDLGTMEGSNVEESIVNDVKMKAAEFNHAVAQAAIRGVRVDWLKRWDRETPSIEVHLIPRANRGVVTGEDASPE